jgi:lipoprotein-releasing system permease protein
MYKVLLCLRYLRTRYIALASIISVMLGVATLIVVNSVMAGFQAEMYKRLHGILSDIVVESHSLEGIANPAEIMDQIRQTLGPALEAMTPNIHIPAMLSFRYRNQWITKQVNLIGIDRESYTCVSDFGQFLLHPDNRQQLDFCLREGGYGERLETAGWAYRRQQAAIERLYQRDLARAERLATAMSGTAPETADEVEDPFAGITTEEEPSLFDPSREQHAGIVLGIAIASMRQRDEAGEVKDYFLCRPGDDVKVTFPTAGTPPKAVSDSFTIVDLYESKMSEYDASFAFVPLEKLQQLRGMIDPMSGIGAVTAIQIKLAEGADLESAREKLRKRFPTYAFPYHVQSWKDMQGPLLAAVRLETTLLNILLFLIIAVAGFGILATFFMIVVEKTRDIGILKSLGAPSSGIMSIFMGYGLSLGIVGSGVGMVLGLLFVWNINGIAVLIEKLTGREVFDPTIYYFQTIPTIVQPLTVMWILLGALAIAVLASVLPAVRAARLHPVEALRYE